MLFTQANLSCLERNFLMTARSFVKTCYFSYFQPFGVSRTNHSLWCVIGTSHVDGSLLKLQQYGLKNGKPFTHDFSSLISLRSLPRSGEWAILAGNTKWRNSFRVIHVEDRKVAGTHADLYEDHMLGQHYWDYSRTKIITQIRVTADANLAKKHNNHEWEDQSKYASQFIRCSWSL